MLIDDDDGEMWWWMRMMMTMTMVRTRGMKAEDDDAMCGEEMVSEG